MSQFIFPPLTASLDSEQTSGGALPSKQMITGGYHAGGSKVYPLAVDADGQLQIDVVSAMPLPTGAATSALQTAGNNILTTIDADTSSLAGAISGTEMQVDVVASLPAGTNSIGTVILGAGTAAFGKLSANSGVDIGDVDVTSLPSIPAGTNSIGTVILGAGTAAFGKLSANSGVDIGDVTLNAGTAVIGKLAANSGVDIGDVTLNAGTAEIGKLAAGTASIGTVGLNAGSNAIGKLAANSGVDIGDVDVTSLPALPAGTNSIGTVILGAGTAAFGKLSANSGVDIGDVDVTSLPADSKNYVWKEGLDSTIGGISNGILDCSTTNIPSGTQLTVATLSNDVYEIQTVEDIGEFMGIYAGSNLKAILPLGGGNVKINLPSTTVVKLASFSGTAISSGNIAINFLG